MGKSTYSLEGNGTDLSKLYPSDTNIGYSASTNTIKANYMRVVPNSHFWDKLDTFNNYLDYLQMSGNQFYENAFGAEIEHMIIGLENTIKHGYKFKRFAESKLDFTLYKEYPIFTSIENIIEHLKGMGREPKDFNTFKATIENTIKSGLNITNGIKLQRTDVYKCLDGERDYQDEKWGTDGTPDIEKPVAEWINYMEFHLAKAKEKVYYLKTEEALEELRKVTALGVRAMEIHGCPEREAIVDTPPHSGKCDDKDCDCQK
jgi:hypothetical protein